LLPKLGKKLVYISFLTSKKTDRSYKPHFSKEEIRSQEPVFSRECYGKEWINHGISAPGLSSKEEIRSQEPVFRIEFGATDE
jgi:hypothetical protein